MNFAVCVIQPPQYPHSEAFREVAEALHLGLVRLGHASLLMFTAHPNLPNCRTIVLGVNLLPFLPSSLSLSLSEGTILYNLEQVSTQSTWFNPSLLSLFRRYPVWDYSRRNIAELALLGIRGVAHLPIGSIPEWTRIPQRAEHEQDIDVLFYGSLNQRRQAVLTALAAQGLRVESAFGVYGDSRDRLIARAKIVLNLHYYETAVFEVVRVSYLLANRKFVLSESSSDAEEQAVFAPGVVFRDYEHLVPSCLEYLRQAEERQRISQVGYEIMSQRKQADFLRTLVGSEL